MGNRRREGSEAVGDDVAWPQSRDDLLKWQWCLSDVNHDRTTAGFACAESEVEGVAAVSRNFVLCKADFDPDTKVRVIDHDPRGAFSIGECWIDEVAGIARDAVLCDSDECGETRR